jgi:biotin-(acetyl-CoA carboxylase) ligase
LLKHAVDFPVELREQATSLSLAGIDHIDRETLIPVVITNLYKRYQELLSHPSSLHDGWNTYEVGYRE